MYRYSRFCLALLLDPLKTKSNSRFNAYDYTLEQIGKRLFALEENLADALHRNARQERLRLTYGPLKF